MNDPVYNQLREISWRRKLTEPEEAQLQAWLQAHPDAHADWEAEAGLNHLLELLPEAPPVSSNFTALVVQAAQQAQPAPARPSWHRWIDWCSALGWLPRTAVAAALLGLGLFSYQWHVENSRRAMAHDAVEVYKIVVASNPKVMEDPDVMGDFDAIRWLGDLQPPKADPDLLALME